MPRLTRSGFTLVEVLIASSLFMVMIAAFLTLNSSIVQENHALSQKMAASEAARQLSQIFADDSLCKCNTLGLKIQPYSPATNPVSYFATFTQPLKSVCAPPQIVATAGQNLPGAATPLPVAGIYVGDLVDLGPSDVPGSNLFAGNIQLALGDPPGGPKILVRSIQPIRVAKKFYVDNSSRQITGCGASLNAVEYVTSTGNSVRNGPFDSTYSVATCPAGMVAVGGGWIQNSTAVPTGCPSQPYAAVLSSAPDLVSGAWKVLLLCHDYKAFATCHRASIPHGP